MEKLDFKMELIQEVKKILRSLTSVPPVLSGAASLALLREIVFSDKLTDTRYFCALLCLSFVFLLSVILFAYLKKMGKEKDQHILSTVGKIVEDVFKHFGVTMANRDATVTAKEMNPIMQTIVNLVKDLRELSERTYT